MNAFWNLGGYGAFVWPSYLATAVILGAAILICVRAHARALAEVRRLEQGAP